MRVALCLSGLIGSDRGKSYDKKGGTDKVLDGCFNSFKNHIIDKNQVDVFFHTWDQSFEKELVEKYKPKAYKTEPQKTFYATVPGHSKRVQAHYSKWYSTKAVNNLKQQYEDQHNFKYDYVMLSRFDMIWNVDVIFNNLNRDIFYIPGSIKHKVSWGWPDNKSGTNYEIDDLWFISNSKNMDNFCNIYDLINTYIEKEGCPTFKGISNHMLAFFHLKKLNLIPSKTERLFCGEVGLRTSDSDYQIYRNKL